MSYLYLFSRHRYHKSRHQVKQSQRLPRKCFPPIQQKMENVLPLPAVRKRQRSQSVSQPSKKPKGDGVVLSANTSRDVWPKIIRLNSSLDISVIWAFSNSLVGNAPVPLHKIDPATPPADVHSKGESTSDSTEPHKQYDCGRQFGNLDFDDENKDILDATPTALPENPKPYDKSYKYATKTENTLKEVQDDLESFLKMLSIRYHALLRLVFSAMSYQEFRSRCMIRQLQLQNRSSSREIGHLTRLIERLSSECEDITVVNADMQQECETLKLDIMKSIDKDIKETAQKYEDALEFSERGKISALCDDAIKAFEQMDISIVA